MSKRNVLAGPARLWQAVVPMRTSPRNYIGIVTSLLWLVAGVYTVLFGVSQTWKAAGFLIIGVGVVRGALLLRDWNKANRRSGE